MPHKGRSIADGPPGPGGLAVQVLDAVGNTSIARLYKIVPESCAEIYAKLEWENPTGSMKDRMAVSVIARAEKDGKLKPGDTVVEYTGGSTGASLALACAAKGYRLRIVSSAAFSKHRIEQRLGYDVFEVCRTTEKVAIEKWRTIGSFAR